MAKKNVLDLLDKVNNNANRVVDYVLAEIGDDKVIVKVDLSMDVPEAIRLNLLDDSGIKVFTELSGVLDEHKKKIMFALDKIGVDVSGKTDEEVEEIVVGLTDSQTKKLQKLLDFNPADEAVALRNTLNANYELVKMSVKWQDFTNDFDSFWNRLTSEQRNGLTNFINNSRSGEEGRFQGVE